MHIIKYYFSIEKTELKVKDMFQEYRGIIKLTVYKIKGLNIPKLTVYKIIPEDELVEIHSDRVVTLVKLPMCRNEVVTKLAVL